MLIQPLLNFMSNNNHFKKSATQSKGLNTISSNDVHKYTGNVSADLAYASMVDDNIAKDLRSMNLIG